MNRLPDQRELFSGFHDWKIEKNLSQLRGLKQKSELLSDVFRNKTTLYKEVADLFYYFGSLTRSIKNRFKIPKLPENHDSRLSDIVEVVQPLDLITKEESDILYGKKEALDEILYKQQTFMFPNIGPTPSRLSAEILRLEGLKGPIDVEEIYFTELFNYLRNGKYSFLAMSGLLAGSVFIWYLTVIGKDLQDGVPNESLIPSLSGLAGVYWIYKNLTNTPPAYLALMEKARRTDLFIHEYGNRF